MQGVIFSTVVDGLAMTKVRSLLLCAGLDIADFLYLVNNRGWPGETREIDGPSVNVVLLFLIITRGQNVPNVQVTSSEDNPNTNMTKIITKPCKNIWKVCICYLVYVVSLTMLKKIIYLLIFLFLFQGYPAEGKVDDIAWNTSSLVSIFSRYNPKLSISVVEEKSEVPAAELPLFYDPYEQYGCGLRLAVTLGWKYCCKTKNTNIEGYFRQHWLKTITERNKMEDVSFLLLFL